MPRYRLYLLALPLLVAALAAGCAGSQASTDGPSDGEPITDFFTLADDGARLVGRTFRLTDMRAQRVVGDSTFWMGPQSEDGAVQLFSVLEGLDEAERAGASGTDGRYTVRPGDVFTAEGVIAAMPPGQATRWGLDAEPEVYLSVRRLTYPSP